ncbi:MAG TPA: type II toxin-antitoxin system PemK/MazF family toxin [Terriglobales bacterium]|nr:type II toxin-antitoxin system PemK/MazF family toxin [Terriglobales bacterium]
MSRDIARGDVRLYRFASPDKTRPVVVLTRDSALSRLTPVTVAPITLTIRGVASEVCLNETDGMKAPCAVNLHNAATVAREHLGARLTHLSETRMNEICAALHEDGPQRGRPRARRFRAPSAYARTGMGTREPHAGAALALGCDGQ